jgi:hypothetical protein
LLDVGETERVSDNPEIPLWVMMALVSEAHEAEAPSYHVTEYVEVPPVQLEVSVIVCPLSIAGAAGVMLPAARIAFTPNTTGRELTVVLYPSINTALKEMLMLDVALAIRMLVVGEEAEGTVLKVEPAVMLKNLIFTGACPLLHVAVRSCFCPESRRALVAREIVGRMVVEEEVVVEVEVVEVLVEEVDVLVVVDGVTIVPNVVNGIMSLGGIGYIRTHWKVPEVAPPEMK